MNSLTGFLKRHPLVIGILLMFVLTWPIDLANAGFLPFQVPFGVYILLGWGFIVASLCMTALTLGKGGAIALLKRFLIWRVAWKWYLAAFLLLPSLQLGAVLLNAALTRTPVDFSTVFAYKIFGPSAELALLILPFFLFDAIANGEEIGWRGYVLPRLQSRYSALASSLIVGLIWGLWHLPKHLPHWDTLSFVFFMVAVLARAVLYTWLYNNTRGSLLLTTLFHASANTGGVFLPAMTTVAQSSISLLLIQTSLEVLAALLVTATAGAARLSRPEPKQIQEQSSPPEQENSSIPTFERVIT
jgi:membrane protease YdiL (CAAX protease family)